MRVVGVEQGQAVNSSMASAELGELRAVRKVPDDDGGVAAPRRETVAVERHQAPDGQWPSSNCLPSSKLQMVMTELSRAAGREPVAVERGQAPDNACALELGRSSRAVARFQAAELSQLPDARRPPSARPGTTPGRCAPSARGSGAALLPASLRRLSFSCCRNDSPSGRSRARGDAMVVGGAGNVQPKQQ